MFCLVQINGSKAEQWSYNVVVLISQDRMNWGEGSKFYNCIYDWDAVIEKSNVL